MAARTPCRMRANLCVYCWNAVLKEWSHTLNFAVHTPYAIERKVEHAHGVAKPAVEKGHVLKDWGVVVGQGVGQVAAKADHAHDNPACDDDVLRPWGVTVYSTKSVGVFMMHNGGDTCV